MVERNRCDTDCKNEWAIFTHWISFTEHFIDANFNTTEKVWIIRITSGGVPRNSKWSAHMSRILSLSLHMAPSIWKVLIWEEERWPLTNFQNSFRLSLQQSRVDVFHFSIAEKLTQSNPTDWTLWKIHDVRLINRKIVVCPNSVQST